MNRTLTREQKMLGAAGASILFLISLFFPWFSADIPGLSGVSVSLSSSGSDVVPSFWIFLIFAAVAALVLLADAFHFELPAALPAAPIAAYLTTVNMIVTVAIFLEGGHGAGRSFGIWLALIFSIVAAVLAVMHWRSES